MSPDNPFSFKDAGVKKSVEDDVDKTLKKLEDKRVNREFSESINRIKFANQIRNNPPQDNFLRSEFHEAQIKNKEGKVVDKGIAIVDHGVDGDKTIEFTKGIFAIDLNTDADWWFNRSCTVFPLLLDQGIRTHVDIKEGFKPERRRLEFQYIWIIVAALGVILTVTLSFFLLGGA